MRYSSDLYRYTSVSCHDGSPIVPLSFIANLHDGMIPQDGQYVPKEVIRCLFDYENLREDGRMHISRLGIGDHVYYVCYNSFNMEMVVVPYKIIEVRITQSERNDCSVRYLAKAQRYAEIAPSVFNIGEWDLDHGLYTKQEEAEAYAKEVNEAIRKAREIVQNGDAYGRS